MARPLTVAQPSPPPSYNSTDIPAIDSYFFGRWPHLFTLLSREYEVPSDLLVVLLFLWEATVGAKDGPDRGYLALSQIPAHLVRERNTLKWLAAFTAAEIFTVEVAGPNDHKGSRYTYDESTSSSRWESFFQVAEWLNKRFKNWDKVKKAEFSKWFAPDVLQYAWLNSETFRLRGELMVEAIEASRKEAK